MKFKLLPAAGGITTRGVFSALDTGPGGHQLSRSLRIPSDPPDKLNGEKYNTPFNRHENRVHDIEAVRAYVEAGRQLAAAIDSFRPDCLLLPLRGAVPIWRVVAPWLNCSPALRLPATSSFVFLPAGESLHALIAPACRCIFEEGFRRVAYVDEVVSGSMARKHAQILLHCARSCGASAGLFALADANGKKMRPDFTDWYNKNTSGGVMAGAVLFVPRLLGEDDRRYSALHYLDYNSGPVCVPWSGNEQDPAGKLAIDSELMRLLSRHSRV